jgi:hypothetical protein
LINCDLKVRILVAKNNCVFYEIRGVKVRVYNYEKLSVMSRNDIDENFDLIGIH